MKRVLLIALAVLFAFVGTAEANHHRHHHHHHRVKHCKKGYRRVVKHKRHHRKVIRCVKRRKAPGSTPPAQAPPVKRTKLHATLDPTYTRDPLDPFKVTYAFSASASSETQIESLVESEPASLPSGVLSLYSDGLLECAINVGAETTEGECPVQYQALGVHRVTTVYTSGEQSATATELETIEPITTSTQLSYSYEDLPGGPEKFGDPSSPSWKLGTLTITASSEPFGAAILNGPAWLPHELNGSTAIPVVVTTELHAALGGEPTCEEIKTAYASHGVTWPRWEPESDTTVTAHAPAGSGYTASSKSVELQFSPTTPC